MTYKKLENENGLILNSKAKEALDEMMEKMTFFVNAMQSNETIQKSNQALDKNLKRIAQELKRVRDKLNLDDAIHAEELMKLANDLNRATQALKLQKFEDNKDNVASRMGIVAPRHKSIDDMPEHKKREETAKIVMTALEIIKGLADIILMCVMPQFAPFWIKITQACVDFASMAKDKILNLMKKREQTISPKPVEAHAEHQHEYAPLATKNVRTTAAKRKEAELPKPRPKKVVPEKMVKRK